MVPSNSKQARRLIQARTISVHQIVLRVKLKRQVFARRRNQARDRDVDRATMAI